LKAEFVGCGFPEREFQDSIEFLYKKKSLSDMTTEQLDGFRGNICRRVEQAKRRLSQTGYNKLMRRH